MRFIEDAYPAMTPPPPTPHPGQCCSVGGRAKFLLLTGLETRHSYIHLS